MSFPLCIAVAYETTSTEGTPPALVRDDSVATIQANRATLDARIDESQFA